MYNNSETNNNTRARYYMVNQYRSPVVTSLEYAFPYGNQPASILFRPTQANNVMTSVENIVNAQNYMTGYVNNPYSPNGDVGQVYGPLINKSNIEAAKQELARYDYIMKTDRVGTDGVYRRGVKGDVVNVAIGQNPNMVVPPNPAQGVMLTDVARADSDNNLPKETFALGKLEDIARKIKEQSRA